MFNWTLLFEFVFLIMFLLGVYHAYKTKGKTWTFAFFAPTVFWAWLFEFVMINYSENFFPDFYYYYTLNLHFLIFRVASVAIIGWPAVLYCVRCLSFRFFTGNVHKIPKNLALASVLSGFLALSIDLVMDPLATVFEWWFWMKDTYFRTPLVNYVGWFLLIAFHVYYFGIVERKNKNKSKLLYEFSKTIPKQGIAVFILINLWLLFVGL